jgi:hypothetical protein
MFSLFYFNHIFLADQTNVGRVFEKNQIQRTAKFQERTDKALAIF